VLVNLFDTAGRINLFRRVTRVVRADRAIVEMVEGVRSG
jgi:hypothetical protein